VPRAGVQALLRVVARELCRAHQTVDVLGGQALDGRHRRLRRAAALRLIELLLQRCGLARHRVQRVAHGLGVALQLRGPLGLGDRALVDRIDAGACLGIDVLAGGGRRLPALQTLDGQIGLIGRGFRRGRTHGKRQRCE
jgi:hypothetical protein